MNIIVCVKPVPDVSIVTLDPKTGLIDSDDLVYIINPYDIAAVEEALRIKEMDGISSVILISLAPSSTGRLLRRCLAMGADEAGLIWDSSFENLDSYATGVILSRAIDARVRIDDHQSLLWHQLEHQPRLYPKALGSPFALDYPAKSCRSPQR